MYTEGGVGRNESSHVECEASTPSKKKHSSKKANRPMPGVMRRNGQEQRQARRRSGQWRGGSRCCYGWRHAQAWREKPEFKRPAAQ